jgi:hypothetical protein
MDQDNTDNLPPIPTSVAAPPIVPCAPVMQAPTVQTFDPQAGQSMVYGVYLMIASAIVSLVMIVPSLFMPIPAGFYHGLSLVSALGLAWGAWLLTTPDPANPTWFGSLRWWVRPMVMAMPLAGMIALVGSYTLTPETVSAALLVVYGILLLVGTAGSTLAIVYKARLSQALRRTGMFVCYCILAGFTGLGAFNMIKGLPPGPANPYRPVFSRMVDIMAPAREQMAAEPRMDSMMSMIMVVVVVFMVLFWGAIVMLDLSLAKRIKQQAR